MKIRKIIIIFMIIVAWLTIVKATSESYFNVKLQADKTYIKQSEREIVITLNVSDINMGQNGINTLEGTINYDTSIFEEITNSSIQELNNWSVTYNDESSTLNGKFLAVNLSSGITEDMGIFTVAFKIRDDIEEVKNTKIEFKDITSNDGTNLINIGTKSIEINSNGQIQEITENQAMNSNSTNRISKINTSNKNILIVVIVVIIIAIMLAIIQRKRKGNKKV